MHVADLLFANMFEVEVDGRPAGISDVFPDWNVHDRFGLLIYGPLGGLGATHLLQIAITSFYDVKPTRRTEHKIYPEIYALHVGKGWGAHTDFDFWPPRREPILSDDPRDVLDAINDRGITRLAMPERPARKIIHRPKEEDAALENLVTTIAYSPTGRVSRPDFSIKGIDRRTESNPKRVLRPIVITPAMVEQAKRSGMALKEVDPEFGELQLRRQAEISEEERKAAEETRNSLRTNGLATETYRFMAVADALKTL